MSLDGLINDTNDWLSILQQGTNQVVDYYKQAAGVEADNAMLYQSIGQNQAIVETAKADQAAAVAGAKAKAGEMFGIDLNKNADIQQKLADTLLNARAAEASALDAVKQKQSVSFTQDPLTWVINKLTINDDIEKVKTLKAIGDQASNTIQELNSRGSSLAVSQEQFAQPLSLAARQAFNENLQKLAALKGNDSWIKGLMNNAMGVQEALKTPKERISLEFQLNSTINAEKSLQISQEHLNLSKEEWLTKSSMKALDDSTTLQALNFGGANRLGDGFPGYSSKDLTLLRAQLNAPVKDGRMNAVQLDYVNGLTALSNGGVAPLAASPGNAYTLLQDGIRMNLPGSMDSLKEIIGKAADAVRANPAGIPKTVAEFSNQVTEKANGILAQATKEIVPGTKNPFEIAPLQALISASPEIQALPITEKLLKPLISAGVDISTPEKLYAQISSAVTTGKLTYQEALEATTIFGIGVKTNLEQKQFTKLGFTPPGDGSWFSYKTSVQVDPYSLFGRNQIIDWTKPDSLGRALNSSWAASMKQGLQGQLETNTPGVISTMPPGTTPTEF